MQQKRVFMVNLWILMLIQIKIQIVGLENKGCISMRIWKMSIPMSRLASIHKDKEIRKMFYMSLQLDLKGL